jgi:methionyl-tRNA formyltransferase
MTQATTVIFFGTAEFAVPLLHSLARDPRFLVRLVVTQPDRPAGRGRRLTEPPVKRAGLELALEVWQPESVRQPEARARLEREVVDLYVVAAYGEILPRAVLRLPRFGAINVHPSLLPKYRGASPVQAAVLNGDRETGVSFIVLTERMDAGPVIAQFVEEIGVAETAGELAARLAALAATKLPDVLDRYARGELTPIPQDEAQATYTRPLTKEDGRIDWGKSAAEIERLVRAMQPWPRAWTTVRGERIVVLRVHISQEALRLPPGSIHTINDCLLVGTGTDPLVLDELVAQGRKRHSGIEWWRGARLPEQTSFT